MRSIEQPACQISLDDLNKSIIKYRRVNNGTYPTELLITQESYNYLLSWTYSGATQTFEQEHIKDGKLLFFKNCPLVIYICTDSTCPYIIK